MNNKKETLFSAVPESGEKKLDLGCPSVLVDFRSCKTKQRDHMR